MTGFKFEEAIKILVSYFPEEAMKKPTLYHSLRVGVYLWNHGYTVNIQIAGLLHDALEDTDMPEQVIGENFGDDVLKIVKANSKNNNLDKSEILEDIIKRCH
ncbi:HD domain-containing protein [Candidatus Gracilibacteria bacterium]|nr:HD domain-containing protein [Candidatus Gracilibacteria bacterium]